MDKKSQIPALSAFPVGSKNEAYAKYFVGQSYLGMLTSEGVVTANVTFEPGCRNNWHIHHKGGQILLCTGGHGWYQEWGKPARRLSPGDAVTIPPEVKHWHGAAKDEWFAHIAVEVPSDGGSTEWLEPVNEDGYLALGAGVEGEKTEKTKKVTAGRDALGGIAPQFAAFNDDILFGEVWSREKELAPRDRSLITVAALMGAGVLDSSLEYHIAHAKENGVTKEEMAEAVTQLAFYAGWPKAWAAFRYVKKIYGD